MCLVVIRKGKGYYGDREGSRRPTVPIIDILGLGKHEALKPSQKHTLLKSQDKPPLSRRCECVSVSEGVCVFALKLKHPHFLCTCAQVCTPITL